MGLFNSGDLDEAYERGKQAASTEIDRLTAALSLAERERDVANGMVDRLALIAQESRRERDSLREQLAQAQRALAEIATLTPEIKHHGGIAESDDWSYEHRQLVKSVGTIARNAARKRTEEHT